MKKMLVVAALLFAVNAHAANIWLGTPFASGGKTYVPIMGSGIPEDMVNVTNVNLAFTGTVAVDEGGANHLQNVWPNNWPTGLFGHTTAFYDDIGLGYPEWYVSMGYASQCNTAAASGIVGSFAVTGSGTVSMYDVYGVARDCTEAEVALSVSTAAVQVGQGGGGGGGGGGHEEGIGVTVEAPRSVKPKRRSTWGAVKAIYR